MIDERPCPGEDELIEFLRGTLEPHQREQLDAHVDRCSSCRQLMSDLARTSLVSHDGSVAVPGSPLEAEPLRPGAVVGRYVVLKLLGCGGMAVVYCAYDPDLDRKVAVKLLKSRSASPEEREAERQRLQREGQAMAKIAHPSVAAVFDVGLAGDDLFLAMEFFDGGTLGAWLRSERRPWREILAAFIQAGRGLAAAHALEIVHRDFKPDNVLLATAGRIAVTDFGLAGACEASAVAPAPDCGENAPKAASIRGFGTPAYVAPEQASGRAADARGDQFSFASALYEALYGELPFEGATLEERLESIQNGRIRPAPRKCRVPAAVRAALLRALRSDPSERYPTMDGLLAQLSPVLQSPWRRRVTAAALLVAATSVTVAAIGSLRPQPCEGAEAKLAGVWDAELSERVHQAFVATGVPYAGDAWTQVSQRLSRRATEWAIAWRQACEATARGEQSAELLDLRMTCLASRLEETRALTSILAEADAPAVRRAVRAAASLPDLSACSKPEALLSVPKPADDAKERVASVRARLAAASASWQVGRFEDALTKAGQAVAEADDIGYHPLQAQALLTQAKIRLVVEPQAAAPLLEKAALHAIAGRSFPLAIEAAAAFSGTVTQTPDSIALGERWLELAQAFLVSAGGDARLLGHLENARGNLAFSGARFEEALRHHREALRIAEGDAGIDTLKLSASLANVGTALNELGRHEEAAVALRRSIDLLQGQLGREHPEVALSLYSLAGVLRNQGKAEDAAASAQRALAILTRHGAADGRVVGAVRCELGTSQLQGGRLEDAERNLRAGLKALEDSLGPSAPDLVFPLHALAELALLRKDPSGALSRLRRASEILEAAHVPDERTVDLFWRTMGRALAAQGKFGEAQASAERSLRLEEARHGPANPTLVPTLCLLARAQQGRKDFAAANRTLGRARALDPAACVERTSGGALASGTP